MLSVVLALRLPGLVTATFAPCPLPKALEKLSAAMGERLSCAPVLQNETLVARLKDADKERVLREVAACFEAKWESSGSELILKPDAVLRRKREQKRRAEELRTTRAALDEVAVDLAKLPSIYTKGEADAHRRKLEKIRTTEVQTVDPNDPEIADRSPEWRAAARLVLGLGAATFANMREGERIVWAERPTPMQRSFGAGLQGVLATFRREQALLDPKVKIDRVRLTVQGYVAGPYSIGFEALDASGQSAASVMLSLSDSSPSSEEAKPTASPLAEKPLVLPKDAREYFTLMSSRLGSVRGELFDAWRPRLDDPFVDEPTAWYPGLALITVAENQDRNLIGTISEMIRARITRPEANLTAATFLRSLDDEVSLVDGWLIAHPLESPTRVSRLEARGLFARAIRQGGLDLDTAAEWQGSHPGSFPQITWVGAHLSALLYGRGAYGVSRTLDEDSTRLWYALGASTRAGLRRGTTIPLVKLPAAAQQVLMERVYWGDDLVADERDVTEALPFGLVNGTVALKIEEEPVVVPWSETKGEPVFRSVMSADALGTQLGNTQRRNVELNYDRYRLGMARKYRLIFAFAPEEVAFDVEMSEAFFDPSGKPVDRLPDAFRARAEEARQRVLLDPDLDPPVNNVKPR